MRRQLMLEQLVNCTAEMLEQLTRFFSLRFKGRSTACDELGFT